MKKLIILLITISMLLMFMTACSGSKDPEPKPDDPDSQVTQTVYSLLNELSKKDCSNIEVDILVTNGFAELYSNFVLTESTVVYSIEKLNLLTFDGEIIDLPSSYKTTMTGYALIENGRVIELDGSKDVTLPSYDELKGNFNFDESNFKNILLGTGSFEADVINPSQFYGADADMSNLKVKIEYTESSLTELTVSYNTTNATVQTVYAFKN